MKRSLLAVSMDVCLVIATAVGATSFGSRADASVGTDLRHFPSTLLPTLPYDVDIGVVAELVKPLRQLEKEGKTAESAALLERAQREFDILSWQAFLALNWPSVAGDGPDPTPDKLITDKAGQPLWSFWRPSQTIFLPNGKKPDPWNWRQTGLASISNQTALLKTKAAWRQTASPDNNFEAFSGPLVDQNGRWVRYEALVNETEFDYIFRNDLYSLDGQIAFSEREEDNEVLMPVNQGMSRHGSIEVKLAWKELGLHDDHSRFYVKKVRVKVSPLSNEAPVQYRDIDAGLVGMHISMRTESSPEWIWATFEQVDNVRQNPLAHGGMSHANFMDPALKGRVPVNQLPLMNAVLNPATGAATTWAEILTKTPVQVERVVVPTQSGLNPMDAQLATDVAELNTEVQAILRGAGSAFQYYELIGTQWPVHKNAPAYTGGLVGGEVGSAPESIAHKTPGDVLPVFLVNTTMETYFQHGMQKAGPLEEDDRLTDNNLIDSTQVRGTESCVGCHYSAGICIGYKKNLDGTPYLAANGARVPIFGDRNNFGKTGTANFSWMLEIEAGSPNLSPPSATPATRKSGIKPNVQP